MAHIGIFYGSTTGNTEDSAKKIAKALDEHQVEIFDVASADADFTPYDLILFGSSSWGSGELQDDWEDFIEKVEASDLSGKKVALFGTGDSASYSDTFGGALSHIYEVIQKKGVVLIGRTPTEGYSFDTSDSVVDGQFVGLLLDEDNESEKSEQRISLWLSEIKKNL